MDNKTKSSNIATIAIIGQIASMLGPLLGGLLGALLGAQALLAVTILCCLAALLPLRAVRDMPANTAAEDTIRYGFGGSPARDIWANYFFNIETSIGVMVWPIYLAVYLRSFRSVGVVASIAAAATIAATWLAGRRGDRGKDRAVLRQGATASSLIHLSRLFATTTLLITFVSLGYQASLAYLTNAWVSSYYYHAKQKGLRYILSMEIANDLAYASLWGVLLLVSAVSSGRAFFVVAFVVAAAAAWGCLLITRQGQLESSTGQP